jgi:hypothetical protein
MVLLAVSTSGISALTSMVSFTSPGTNTAFMRTSADTSSRMLFVVCVRNPALLTLIEYDPMGNSVAE